MGFRNLQEKLEKQDFFCSPTNQEKRLPKMSRPAAHNSYLISAKKIEEKKHCQIVMSLSKLHRAILINWEAFIKS